MKTNLIKFYIASFLGGLSFTNGILVLYYRDCGFSFTQIFIISVVYELLTFLLEIPSGVLADLWSRKWVVTIGHTISGLSFLVVLLAPRSYVIFIIWSVLSAVCTALNSGTMTAIIYDTLKQEDQEDVFYKVQSNITILILFSQTISIVIGGWIASTLSFNVTLVFSSAAGLLQAALLATLNEPDISSGKKKNLEAKSINRSWEPFLQHFKESIRFMLSSRNFLSLSLYSILGFIAISVFGTILQPYLAGSGWNSYLEVSLLIAAINLFTMLALFLVRKQSGAFSQNRWLYGLPILIAFVFITAGFTQGLWVILLLAILSILLELFQLIMNTRINQITPSEKRATILSTQNQMNSLSYSLVAVAIGSVIDKGGLGSISIGLGICFFLAPFLFRIVTGTHREETSSNQSR